MKRLIVIALLALAFGACKKGKFDQVAADLEGFRDKMCACKDKKDAAEKKSCADDVKKDVDAYKKEMGEKFKDDKQEPPEELLKRIKSAEKEFRKCRDDASKGDATQRMKEMRDDMCACKDSACVDGVTKKWAAKAPAQTDAREPTEEDMKLAKEMTECAQKAMSAAAPAGAPAPASP